MKTTAASMAAVDRMQSHLAVRRKLRPALAQ